MKNAVVMFVLLFGVWLLLNMSVAPEILIAGGVVSLVIVLLFSAHCGCFRNLKLTPKSMLLMIVYVFVFLFELIKSNLDVMRRVLSPSLPINPGIVAVKTSLKSRTARMILANSITLTPGTFTIEIDGDTLYIHWIDVAAEDMEKATKKIVRKFEKYLEVIYG